MSLRTIMSPVDYSCLLPPHSLTALEAISTGTWSQVELAAPVWETAALRARADKIRICGSVAVVIAVMPVDLLPKLECFRLDASIADRGGSPDPRFRAPIYQDSGELLSAFLGKSHQVLLGARRYAPPEWASDRIGEITVEDILVLRHTSGQHAFVAPDDANPGSLIIARDRKDIPNSDAEIAYLRPL